jgi:hypothetical protein
VRVVSLLSLRLRFAAPLGLLFGVLATCLFAGCGSDTPTSICEARCTCANACVELETQSCVESLGQALSQAASRGCNANAEADNYLSCEAERATCAAGSYANNNCVAETQTFFSCLARVGCNFRFSENRVDCDS